MATDADTADRELTVTDEEVMSDALTDNDDSTVADDGATPPKEPKSPLTLAIMLGLSIVVGFAALGGWLGFQSYQGHQKQQQRNLFVQAARQGAVNLTTVDWQTADTDVKRILDCATGTFYDDFSRRSQAFIDVVKKVQAKSTGTVSEAGLESEAGNEAQVMVAATVQSSNLGDADQGPRNWRMRITVQKAGDAAKVANVAFVS
jgi:Mce-associated membrane protein